MIINRFLWILLLAGITSSTVQSQSLRTVVPGDSLQVGDTFTYSLIVQLDKEYDRIIYPDTASWPAVVESRQRQTFKTTNFTDSLSYSLQFFGTEDLIIPPLSVTLISATDTTQLFTEPVSLPFKTVLPADTSQAVTEDLKPIFTFEGALWPWLLAALLLAGVLIWWFFFRKEKETEVPVVASHPAVFHDPLLALEKELQEIKEQTDIARTKDFKKFYSLVGDAIRRYFEDLYLIPALESTTRECMRYLDAYGVDQQMADYTRKILNRADMVKFAKFTPSLEDAWATYEMAVSFKERAQEEDRARISRKRRDFEQKQRELVNQQQEEQGVQQQ